MLAVFSGRSNGVDMTLYELALGAKRYWYVLVGCLLIALAASLVFFFAAPRSITHTASLDVVANSQFNSFIGVVNNQADAVRDEHPEISTSVVPEVVSKTVSVAVTSAEADVAQELVVEIAARSTQIGRAFFAPEEIDRMDIAFDALYGVPVVSQSAGTSWAKVLGCGVLCGVLLGALVIIAVILFRDPVIVPKSLEKPGVDYVDAVSSGSDLDRMVHDVLMMDNAHGSERICLIPLGEKSLSCQEVDRLKSGLESLDHGVAIVDADAGKSGADEAKACHPEVIVCHPLSVNMDAAIVAQDANVSILVARRFQDRQDRFTSAVRALKLAGAKKICAVLVAN